MKILCNVTLTDVLAVWGATVATLILFWDIIKWKTSGPKVSFSVSPNMHVLGSSHMPDDKRYISVCVTNTGDRATTITNLGIVWYKNWFYWVLRRHHVMAIIVLPNPHPGFNLPYVLKPGTTWNGWGLQEEAMERKPRKGILFFELFLSHKRKPKRMRVMIKDKKI